MTASLTGLAGRDFDVADEHFGEFVRDTDREPSGAELVAFLLERSTEEEDRDPFLAGELRHAATQLELVQHPDSLDAAVEATVAGVLGELLVDAIDEFLEAAEHLAVELSNRSNVPAVRRFNAYHLAALEGRDGPNGWLVQDALVDQLRALRSGKEA